MSISTGYNCTSCGKFHEYSAYLVAHRMERIQHTCDLCGAIHTLYDGYAYRWKPGHVPAATTREELAVAAGVQLPLLTEPALTDWINEHPPEREGYYHIRFPNGTEADRNWYWSRRTFTFLYDKDSPVSLAFGSIGAWRGLDREYN
jgi:hypothetical protein